MSRARAISIVWLALLCACASEPPAPGWKLQARSALERGTGAWLEGRTQLAEREFATARDEVARTGRPDLLARAELTRCAVRVASLQFEPCAGFERLRADAAPAETAYAAYLTGRASAADVPLLPEQHRAVANPSASPVATAAALRSMPDPVARQVAAGVLLQAGRASPEVIATAIDNASAQGWRRPLLAWLTLQAQRAQLAGDTGALERIRRRIALVEGAR